MKNPLGVTLSSYSMFEDAPVGHLLQEELDGTGSSTLSEAAIIGFNRHAKLMSPATRELVLRSRKTEIEAFAEDRGLDPHVVAMVCEVAMRTGRVPDLRQYGFAGDEALAVKHFVAGEILNLAIEDIEKMERDDLAEADGKKKLHPSMHKHTDADHFKAHVGDPKDEKKPFHKGKGLEAGLSFDKERGFLAEGRSSPEVMQKFYDLMDQKADMIFRFQEDPEKLTKLLVMLARKAGMTPLQAIGPAVLHAAKYARKGKLRKKMVVKENLDEVSPPGFSGTVKAMKDRHPEIDNPYALAWSMYKKGDKPHKAPESDAKGVKKYMSPAKYAEKQK